MILNSSEIIGPPRPRTAKKYDGENRIFLAFCRYQRLFNRTITLVQGSSSNGIIENKLINI